MENDQSWEKFKANIKPGTLIRLKKSGEYFIVLKVLDKTKINFCVSYYSIKDKKILKGSIWKNIFENYEIFT